MDIDPRGLEPIEAQLAQAFHISAYGRYYYPEGDFLGKIEYFREGPGHPQREGTIHDPYLRTGVWSQRTPDPEHLKLEFALEKSQLTMFSVTSLSGYWDVDFINKTMVHVNSRGERSDCSRFLRRMRIDPERLNYERFALDSVARSGRLVRQVIGRMSILINKLATLGGVPAGFINSLQKFHGAIKYISQLTRQ